MRGSATPDKAPRRLNTLIEARAREARTHGSLKRGTGNEEMGNGETWK